MSDRLQRVIGNYEVKLRLGANGRLAEDQLRARVDRFGTAMAQEDAVLHMVRQILCSHGVVMMMFPYYHAFSRELGKLCRQDYSAESLQEMYAVCVAKWVMRGLLRPVLVDIGANAFNLALPLPPGDQ